MMVLVTFAVAEGFVTVRLFGMEDVVISVEIKVEVLMGVEVIVNVTVGTYVIVT